MLYNISESVNIFFIRKIVCIKKQMIVKQFLINFCFRFSYNIHNIRQITEYTFHKNIVHFIPSIDISFIIYIAYIHLECDSLSIWWIYFY